MADKTLPFTKMQGTGNDFIVIDNRDLKITLPQIIERAPDICNRRFGVGADGILLLENPSDPAYDYTMIYRNADGSDAGMCGNGARCLARFAHQLGLGTHFTFNVHDSVYQAAIKNQQLVEISFPDETSVVEKHGITDHLIYQIFTGTEHIVLQVEEKQLNQENKLRTLGRQLRYHKEFQPKGTNVNFFSGIDPSSLKLQTYERGVENITLACGTGAIASAIAWHHIQQLNTSEYDANVYIKGGELDVKFSYDSENASYSEITLTGPAKFVFTGTWHV